jgi:predicted DNA-binding transcriptional regulator
MSAIHPILEQALRPFAPKPSTDTRLMAMTLRATKAEGDLASLIRSPFQVEVRTRDASRNGPAEYAYVTAPDELVIQAIDALIDKHIDELEADVKRRMDQAEVEL